MSYRRMFIVMELTVAPEADDPDVAIAVESALTADPGVRRAGVRSISLGLPHMHLPRAIGR